MDSNDPGAQTAFMPPTTATLPRPGLDLGTIDAMSADAFVACLGGVVEHAPWVARRAWSARPFGSVASVVAAMRAAIHAAPIEEQHRLLRGHPELAGQEARDGRMTPESTGEQGRLGLMNLPQATVRRIESVNRRYRERFGYPLVIALRLHADLESVLAEGERRLAHDPRDELRVALDQVCEVMAGRVSQMLATTG